MSSSTSANIIVLLGLGLAGIVMMTRKLRQRVIKKDFGAFLKRFEILPPPQPAPPKAPHPLTGLTFAVADVFDIEGYVTGFGNPDWEKTHEPASQNARAISSLIEGGATCVGKTVIDEMGVSITGENKHFGTPTNPYALDQIPGGCSSGSAVAVASDLVDFTLGLDTTGGVRIPGAYCGTFAFRPSHSAISNSGILPVSPSLDTTGWFAKDPSILRRVGHILLKLSLGDLRQPRHVIIADDCFQLLKTNATRLTQVVVRATENKFGRQVLNHVNLGDYLWAKITSLKENQNEASSSDQKLSSLAQLAMAMQSLMKHEFKIIHEEWIKSGDVSVDPHILTLVSDPSETKSPHIDVCQKTRNETQLALNSLLKDDGILVLPTVFGPPPKLNGKETQSADFRSDLLCLTAIASMSGCCQVTIPLDIHEKFPASISFIARQGGDRFLLDIVNTMYPSLKEQINTATKSKISDSSIGNVEAAEIEKEKGNAAFKEKQWQKAISLYTKAIKQNEKNATYYSNRAAAFLEVGSYLQAEADCTKAISIDKKSVKSYLRRGTAREMLGYYKEAIEDFKYALVLEPTNKTANKAVDRIKKFIPL